MALEIEVVDDPRRACAAMLVGVAAGGGQIVVTGGSTPRAAYVEFVEAVQTVGIDVSQCAMWFSDERCVPPEDERSNYGMVREALLEPLGESAAGGGSASVRPRAAGDRTGRPPGLDVSRPELAIGAVAAGTGG
jgi:hypothetical protein